MFSLSFGKILLIVLVIVAVWRGVRLFRLIEARLASRGGPERAGGARPAPRATDLVECPRCGMFVPNGTYCPSVERCRYRRTS